MPLRPKWCHALLAAITLAGCGSTPLPPWPTQPQATVAPPPKAPLPKGLRLPDTKPPAGVVVTPLPLSQAQTPSTVTSAPAIEPIKGPYSQAVAERFPEPPVRYETPGLQNGRQAFTTNAELEQWLHDTAAATPRGPTRAQVLSFGRSQQGSMLHALVVTRASGTDAASLEASARPTVVLIGQQHGDEPAGSEALLVIARELTQGPLEPLLDRINVVLVPRANPDGAEAGRRVTANGTDLNRDHLLLETPEAQALATLVRDYRPTAVLDAHEFTVTGRFLQKFGAIQRYDALLQYATTANVSEFLTKASHEWYYQPMVDALALEGLSSDWYYTTSTKLEDKVVSMGGTQPDTGRNVNGLKNAVSFLVETRGVGIGRMHIQRRVHTQVTAIRSALSNTAARAASLAQVRSFVARETSSQACQGQVVVEAGPTPGRHDLAMLDPLTGADRILSVDWNSSLTLRPLKTRARPCGYWLSADAATAATRLKMMGVQVLRVAEPASLLAETYTETRREMTQRQDVRGTVAGRVDIIRAEVTPTRSAIDVPPGSYYVPLHQPLANLAVAALEPDTQNSYFANRIIDKLADTARLMTKPSLVFDDAY